MYSTKLLNKSMVPGNAYVTVGDPYKAPDPNPFRQGKKGEKITPFRTKVSYPQTKHFIDRLSMNVIISFSIVYNRLFHKMLKMVTLRN